MTQAGSDYVAANPPTTLVSQRLTFPSGVAVDAAGNVYIADFGDNAIKEWNAATQTVSTLVSSGLSQPDGVAVDGAGNVYIADTGNNAIKEWNAATQTVSTLVSSGLNGPYGVAVDAAGNVYIADTCNNAIKEWNAATQTVSTLVSSGLNDPAGVAVDAAGNVYIADSGNNAIKEWNAATQTRQHPRLLGTQPSGWRGGGRRGQRLHRRLRATTRSRSGTPRRRPSARWFPPGSAVRSAWRWTPRATSTSPISATTRSRSGTPRRRPSAPWSLGGLIDPSGLAVDGSGNVYIADTGNNAIKEWNAATQTLSHPRLFRAHRSERRGGGRLGQRLHRR